MISPIEGRQEEEIAASNDVEPPSTWTTNHNAEDAIITWIPRIDRWNDGLMDIIQETTIQRMILYPWNNNSSNNSSVVQ
jgi:hypothetical protein